MNDQVLLWLSVAIVALALFSVLRLDLLRLLWREMLRLGGTPPGQADAPPEAQHGTHHKQAQHIAPPHKPDYHRSGRRH